MANLENLSSLVLEGRHLLHGSPKRVSELVPHFTDGEKAICATPYYELAAYMALIRACPHGRCDYNAHMSRRNGNIRIWIEFRVCDQVLRNFLKPEGIHGHIYVLSGDCFSKKYQDGYVEFRTYQPVKPVHVITVTPHDLPFKPQKDQYEYSVTLNPAYFSVFS